MKKIITAMLSQELNKELKKKNNFEVVCNNIQYKEAIIDILKIKKNNNINIDILILEESLPGEINFENLILNIKKINNKIKIIIILKTENSKLKEKTKNLKIKNIYYKQDINIINLINELQMYDEKNKTKLENKKNIKKNNETKINKNKVYNHSINVNKKYNEKKNNNIKKYDSTINNKEIKKYKNFFTNQNQERKKINILNNNIKKRTIILIGDNEKIKEKIIYEFNKIKKYKKILIINFKSINYKNKYKKLNDCVDLLFWRDKIFKKEIDINKELSKLIKKYNFIFLDFEINNFILLRNKFEENKNIILILENSLKQIKLIYKKIKKLKKIKIILYSDNKYKINKKILKIIFIRIRIIGEINKNNYKKIIKKIIKKIKY